MKLPQIRWLIEASIDGRPLGHVLHVFDDGDSDWSPDKTHALCLKTKAAAEQFGRNRLDRDFVVSPHECCELVPAIGAEPLVGEVEVLTLR